MLLLVTALAAVLLVRGRLLNLPLERDEGEYAYAGQLILEGIPPYRNIYNMKMPGTYLAYAAIMRAFGEEPAGIHLGLLVVNLLSILLVFQVAREFLDFAAAAAAAAVFGILALSPAFLGLAAHATHFVVLFALLGVRRLLRFEDSRRGRDSLLSGIFFGIAFLMKQPGIFFGMFGGLYLVWLCLHDAVSHRRAAGRHVVASRLSPLLFALGCILPFLAVCVWLKLAGVFRQFWFWTIDYARQYVEILSLADGWTNARDQFVLTFICATILWGFGLFGLMLLGTGRLPADRRLFLLGFVGFSFLAVCPGLYFRSHYFIVLLPAAALLVGMAVGGSMNWFEAIPWLRLLPIAVVAIGCLQTLVLYRQILFDWPVEKVSSDIYRNNLFLAAAKIGRHIRELTSPQDRIVVIGSEPEIYFYAHRLSSTGYIYTYPLMEPQAFAGKMQLQMIQEIEQNPPAYLVFISVRNSVSSVRYWDGAARQRLFDWASGYVSKNMHLDAMARIDQSPVADVVWGRGASGATPSGPHVAIYRQNGR
jgi:4-amino-4-deoxy-L-arabinose transferase-like glycosyltransferase